ncbi:chromosome partitioning protein ParA [Geomonas paludis]|uniref:Chromosome partitioning protein ParA n=1 Tax=Geomonas paludis TaxID=2740185 RepID=A0ABY4LLW9_9BACT|nr:chromosome partitioning protein ParA [Geomonas paludis]UPU37507.1 chromosome partitioning protein ParA [Geomonas paludis]
MGNDKKQHAQFSGPKASPDLAAKNAEPAVAGGADRQQVLTSLEESLRQREAAVARMEQLLKAAKEEVSRRERDVNEKQVRLEELELQAKNGFPKAFEERFAAFKGQLEQREVRCTAEWASIEAEKEKLRQRELSLQKAEIQRDAGYAAERSSLDAELFNLRKKQEQELGAKRAQFLAAVENEVAGERSSRLSTLEKEIAELTQQNEKLIQKEKADLDQKRARLQEDQARLDEAKDELDYQKQRLASRKSALDERESHLGAEVEQLVAQRRESFEVEKAALVDEVGRLRESVRTSSSLIAAFEELKHKLGGEDPSEVLLQLKTYEEEIKDLRNDLASRPTREMQQSFDRLKSQTGDLQMACERLTEENEALRKVARSSAELEMQVAELTANNLSLVRRFEAVDADNNRLVEDLTRLQATYGREQDREARIRDIELPYIQKQLSRAAGEVEELQWLDGIGTSCMEYGLKFPRRILHAFHTALKTSEWSPITVLAGVSGTGKSELPRLYSHFGGINFLSLSVQPNWDSQESMLGFFNSIDNKFDAQPILRLLAQSQIRRSEAYPLGLSDVMNLVLLDEMNLAHVELYFAEFLSKLELRRGKFKDEVPSLEVKLGASVAHYDLPLGRNVLWAGTMNQDETTKSLSDKVLDRGIIINFPRPTTLERRSQLKSLGEPAPLLSRKLWQTWWCQESIFTDEQILQFKSFIEEMNTSLSKVGRALGHRVWQSIEYYMANYPDVLAAHRNKDDFELSKAMKVAFEDQLVQKVMPKLRGIETRGKSKSECLDKIRTQLVNRDFTIVDDFDLACEFGYGQFIWSSANYLKDNDPQDAAATAENL